MTLRCLLCHNPIWLTGIVTDDDKTYGNCSQCRHSYRFPVTEDGWIIVNPTIIIEELRFKTLYEVEVK